MLFYRGSMSGITFLSLGALFLSIFVVFVNGWTDAPSSVFSVVDSGVLKLWQGVLLSSAFNLLGVFIFSLLSPRVSESILSLGNFENELVNKIVCFSCFLTIIVFGVGAWLFGMPSSESHALIASLAGTSFALGNFDYQFFIRFLKILIYMAFSCVLSFIISYIASNFFKKRALPYKGLLLASSGALSFMHGAQDGQKFIAIIMLLTAKSGKPSIYLVGLVSLTMALSTLLGGKKIIKSLSNSIEKSDTPSAFSSDFASFLTLLICSLFGMPISTGNVKSMSLVGGSIASKRGINKKIITEILLTSVITFPICFIMGLIICKLLIVIFLG